MVNNERSIAQNVGRGILAGVAGTVVMTAFQKLIEVPLTGREESYAPANFAQRVLPVEADTNEELERLNWATHFGLGTMWGSAYGLAAHAGLSGQKAVAAVFGTVYTGDVLLNTALGPVQADNLVGAGLGGRHHRQARPGPGHGSDLRSDPGTRKRFVNQIRRELDIAASPRRSSRC